MNEYQFYSILRKIKPPPEPTLPHGLHAALWRPGPVRLMPPGCAHPKFLVWYAFHSLGVFGNREYGILLIYEGDALVHRSFVFPPSFRFPFMAPADVQIGDTWTRPSHRGKGLAGAALALIRRHYAAPEGVLWYIVESSNGPSIKVIRKADFSLAGTGSRETRFGLGILGYYRIVSP